MSKHTPGPWFSVFNKKMGWFSICTSRHTPRGDTNLVVVVADYQPDEKEANAQLISAAPELLCCQTMGEQMNTPDFLDWIADRLVHVYGESPNVDFVVSLRQRAAAGRAAMAKAEGES